MKITALIENTSRKGLPTEHGLCLWVEACGHKFLFDTGQTDLYLSNAAALGIDVAEAEFAVLSHGHYDHGGGLSAYLAMDGAAPVYVNANAFGDFYSLRDDGVNYIGLDLGIKDHPRVRLVKGVVEIADGLVLFAGADGHEYFSPSNKRILRKVADDLVCDDFMHEQSLIVTEGENRVLIAGCAHAGILNIMARAEAIAGRPMNHVVAGTHLIGVSDARFITGLGRVLLAHNCQCHTCHCTGIEAYSRLRSVMGEKIDYLSCGDTLQI